MTTKANASVATGASQSSERGPWEDRALAQLRAWDPVWADLCERMALNPWKHEVLPRKTVELIGLAVTPPARTSILKALDGISTQHSTPAQTEMRF